MSEKKGVPRCLEGGTKGLTGWLKLVEWFKRKKKLTPTACVMAYDSAEKLMDSIRAGDVRGQGSLSRFNGNIQLYGIPIYQVENELEAFRLTYALYVGGEEVLLCLSGDEISREDD